MSAALSAGTLVKGTGISLVFGGIALFTVGIVQRAQVMPAPIPRPAPAPPARGIGQSKRNAPLPRPTPAPSNEQVAPAPLVNAQAIYKTEPQYSSEAHSARYQGTVHVAVVIDEDGKISDIQILDSPGLGLDQKIIDCLHQWRFKPATRGGIPVSEKGTIDITFKLL